MKGYLMKVPLVQIITVLYNLGFVSHFPQAQQKQRVVYFTFAIIPNSIDNIYTIKLVRFLCLSRNILNYQNITFGTIVLISNFST